jgi:hypothetical protein
MSRSNAPAGAVLPLEFRQNLERVYPDIYTRSKGVIS